MLQDESIRDFVIQNNIEIIIVGPEKPLVEGLTDYLESQKIKVFGPNKLASQLEGSKIFTKKLCEEYNIPTAKFAVLENKLDAKKFLNNSKYPNPNPEPEIFPIPGRLVLAKRSGLLSLLKRQRNSLGYD